nr:MAG TPA: hypothetical protein [Caudoviricetes sp.]DAW32896.1 MAG TPA: hypothetical protein [Caudoviricetes sp.]
MPKSASDVRHRSRRAGSATGGSSPSSKRPPFRRAREADAAADRLRL